MRLFFLASILALTAGCAHLQTAPSAAAAAGPPVTREQVMQSAGAYASHQWQATSANIFHGADASGVWIDTPDAAFTGSSGWYADGRTNMGLPYCWGGDSTLVEFDEGIMAGRPAGYHFNGPRKYHADSSLPVGVDCSGFVSRCWRLNHRRSTYDIGKICERLSSFDDLLPGDAVNKPYDHVILFEGWLDATHEQMRVFEAGDAKKYGNPQNYERVHEDVYSRAWLSKKGFVPLRYKGIIED